MWQDARRAEVDQFGMGGQQLFQFCLVAFDHGVDLCWLLRAVAYRGFPVGPEAEPILLTIIS
jgi:hypothetical protein